MAGSGRVRAAIGAVALGLPTVLCGVLVALDVARGDVPGRAAERGEFVGGAVCATCHSDEAARWTGSHHDLAMAEATDATVRGDFDDATFTYGGVTSRFYRRAGDYWVRTDGPTGEVDEFRVAYAFGVEPLQQYLVPMRGGRLQALSIAWDTRPGAAGGQRWFHLYPDEAVDAADVLHWTKPSQNWNDRCARCHSTELRRRYDAGTDTYATTWQEIDVSCEACHGPGAKHLAWARRAPRPEGPSKGLRVRLRDRVPATWVLGEDATIARRTAPRTSSEIDACASCHARRGDFGDGAASGVPFLDAHTPALLDDGLYFADGQIRDEVYEWGSFLQSRMYAAGVACSDCHDPHGLTLRADGNALCARCHAPARFDGPEHTRHRPGTPGSQCVDCHMPSRVYMGVDARRDHAFVVPAPARSAATAAPDPCSGCHAEAGPEWAAAQLVRAGRPASRSAGAVEALAAGRQGAIDAAPLLVELAGDRYAPAISRATAVRLLGAHGGPNALDALRRAAGDAEPLLRLAAADALSGHAPEIVATAVGPLLADPLRTIRLAAVPTVAAIVDTAAGVAVRGAYERAEREYRAVQRADADRPEAQFGLATIAQRRGRPEEAERELRAVIARAPWFVPAHVNLADLHRERGRDDVGEAVLRKLVADMPESAEGQHALGLLLVRTGRGEEAMPRLERATRLAPEEVRYAYVFGVALHSRGETGRALEVLRAAHERRRGDVAVLRALTTMSRDAGDLDAARRWAEVLVDAAPWDPAMRRLRAALGAVPGR